MKVKRAPSDDLEMPKLDGWFKRTDSMRDMWASDACMFWASSLMCDVGVIHREYQGSKDHGDTLCWDKVPSPSYGFTVFNASLMDDRPAKPESVNFYKHDEYLQCDEKPMTEELLQKHCPMFGHYGSNFLNVSNWGQGFEKDSDSYNQVLQCQAKLGIPESVGRSTELMRRPWSGNISLMDPPAVDQDVSFSSSKEAGQAMMNSIFQTLNERDAWRKHLREAKKAAEEEGKEAKK